jgi:hypothetical protein
LEVDVHAFPLPVVVKLHPRIRDGPTLEYGDHNKGQTVYHTEPHDAPDRVPESPIGKHPEDEAQDGNLVGRDGCEIKYLSHVIVLGQSVVLSSTLLKSGVLTKRTFSIFFGGSVQISFPRPFLVTNFL